LLFLLKFRLTTLHYIIYYITTIICLFFIKNKNKNKIKRKEILNQIKEKKRLSIQVYYNITLITGYFEIYTKRDLKV